MNLLLILLGKFVLWISQTFNLGSGSTWPGHIAMETNPRFVQNILKSNPKLKIVLIEGTNGKTTKSLILPHSSRIFCSIKDIVVYPLFTAIRTIFNIVLD